MLKGIWKNRKFGTDQLIGDTLSSYGNMCELRYRELRYLVVTIFNEEPCLTFKSIFHKALNLVKFDCEITNPPLYRFLKHLGRNILYLNNPSISND